MKLLDKKIIQQSRTSERKMEIDEGAKLARKIDTLRETASSEEARLAKFRDRNLDILRTQIQALVDEKNKLIEEVDSLKKERERYQEIINNFKRL